MAFPQIPNTFPSVGTPPLVFRFSVLFFIGGLAPNPLDTLFQKVSGFEASATTEDIPEGGQNLYTQKVPKGITYGNLTLERGKVNVSPLSIEFNAAMSLFQFRAANVLVTLLDSANLPVSSWLFMKAFPVKWRSSDLDAAANDLVIETLELSYQRFQTISI